VENKIYKVKLDNINLAIPGHSDLLENPIPILWDYKGSYYWIPVETVKNEINAYVLLKGCHPNSSSQAIVFSLQQAYLLRPDVGKILMGN
jgi:hypothetical protein